MMSRSLTHLVVLFLLVSSIAIAESFPVRQEFGQVRSTGRASVTETPQGGNGYGGLVVSNIGSSGEDGVEFQSGGTRSNVGPIRWMAPEALTGRGLSIVLVGEDGTGAPFELSVTTREVEQGFGGDLDQNQVSFNPLATGVPGATMSIRGGGNPLYQGSGLQGNNPMYESSAPPTGSSGSGAWGDVIGVFDHFRFHYPPNTTFTLPSGETFVGDEVALDFDTGQSALLVLTARRVLGIEPQGSTGEIFITDWPGGMFGATAMEMGEATALGIGSSGLDGVDRLLVDNIGSSGQDGVAFAADRPIRGWRTTCRFPKVPAFDGRNWFGPLSLSAGSPTGSELPVVFGQFTADSFFDIWVDLSKAAAPTRVEYVRDGQVIDTVLNPTGPVRLATSVQWPYQLGYEEMPATGEIVTEILYESPVTYTDANGIDNDCDGVRFVHPPDPGLEFHPVDGMFVRAANVPGGAFEVEGLPNINVPEEPNGTFFSAAGMGRAHVLIGDGGVLLADNIAPLPGAAGLDGIRVEWPHGNASLGMTMGTRSKRPPPSRGHVTVLKAFGSGGNKADHSDPIGTLTATGDEADTRIEYAADFSPVGPGPVTWYFYDNGQLVGTETRSNSDTCFGCDGIPVRFTASLDQPDGTPRMTIEFDTARPITLIGGNKAGPAMNKADLVEAVYGAAIVTPFTDVTDLEWRGSGQGAMFITAAGPTGSSGVPGLPAASLLTLHPATPNPFNPRTVVAFELRRDAEVSLQVFDVRGHLVRHVFRGHRPAGTYRETWDGLDDAGRGMASGTYFFRLTGAGDAHVRKGVLVR